MKKSMKTSNKIWKITTSCTLVTEYIDKNAKDISDVHNNFSDCLYTDGEEIDYQNEDIHTVEFSIDGGKTWSEHFYQDNGEFETFIEVKP